jgi:hypothetical protein
MNQESCMSHESSANHSLTLRQECMSSEKHIYRKTYPFLCIAQRQSQTGKEQAP